MGLTPTEAAIYLAGMQQKSVTLAELGKATKIKRPTLYYALHTLMEKGLVSEKKDVNKSWFSMSSPENLRGLVEQQREAADERMKELTTLIPALKQQQKAAHGDDVTVTHYHGIQGMKMLVDIACYCTSHRWEIIAPYNNFLREYDKEYAQRYLRARKNHKITARTLWEITSKTRTLSKEEIAERNPRLMPAAMQGKFKSMIILFDDKVAMFSPFEQQSAILITSPDIHHMFLAMFEAIWSISEEYR